MALAPRDIAVALAVVVLGWPVLNLIDGVIRGVVFAHAGLLP